MSFPRQDSVAARLQAESYRALQASADGTHEAAKVLWRASARLLKADIGAAYAASSRGRGRWDLTALQAGGTYAKLAARAGAVLNDFHRRSHWRISSGLGGLRAEAARRGAWVMSQVTPASMARPRRPRNIKEADAPLAHGFDDRWREWVAGYNDALLRNLRMNALSQGSLQDAVAEVDATRVSTPGYTLDAALDRLWDYYAWEAMAGGMHQAVEGDPYGGETEEVWRTSGDLRVCDDCDANEGETREEADGTVPLHPNCNCFYQIVPASYAELLRSGDEADRELAEQMDRDGVAPNAMVVRGEDGEIHGRTVVDFRDWEEAEGLAVGTGV